MTYFRFLAHARPWLALAAPLAIAPLACQSNVDEQIALAKLAQTCLVNSDCSTPLVCAFEACHAECESSRDCDGGARCVAAARPYKVCQLETERLCKRTSDCAEGLICGVDGECRDKCQTDSACVEGQLCVSGTCADKNELDDSGQLTPAKGMTRGAEGSPCVYVSDCAEALLCRSQACLPECKADKDCAPHQLCMDTRCVADGSQPMTCDYNSDCDSKRGERCLGGSCRCQCVEDRDCPSGDLCNGCGCEPNPKAAPGCTYNSDCKNAGEICKGRACVCECKADADCATGFACDGCGCVDAKLPIAGIVNGGVTINSALQLAGYRGVTEIHGWLTLSGSVLTDLSDTFDQLTLIDGQLVISDAQNLNKVSLPQLKSVSYVSMNGVGAEALELPRLESAIISLNNWTNLTALSLPALQSGELSLYGMPKLTTLDLPVVKTLSMLSLGDVPLVAKVELPELTKISSSLMFSSNAPSMLDTVSAPKLTLIGEAQNGGNVNIDNTKLTSLSGIGAKDFVSHVSSLQIARNALLSDCAAQLFASHFPDRTNTYIADTVACATSCAGEACSN